MVVFAVVLLFDGGFVAPFTKNLSDNTILYIASVGTSVSARIEPTELNMYTAELTQKEKDLNAREAALNAREITARDFSVSGSADYSIYILSIILFILTLLIVVNYAMDWARIKKVRYEEKAA
jgi:hypothetical protein